LKKFLLIIVLCLTFSGPAHALTQAPVDVRYADIQTLTGLMEAGILTSEQLVKIYLERIEAYNPEFNAVNFINENAVNEAIALDMLRRDGKSKGVLHGIPILVKNNIDIAGIPTTAGAKALDRNMPLNDAEVIKRLKDAGAVILGTANMSEFAFLLRDSNSSFGRVKNAYDPGYTSYGSSGGSATGIALSFAAASLGTDSNSSIRVPAGGANLVGFRPSFGLISLRGVLPYDTTRDTVGPMTKTVRDSAIIMSVLSGNNYAMNTYARDLKGKTVGVAAGFELYPPVADLIRDKIGQMERAGAAIVYLDNFVPDPYIWIAHETNGRFTMCDAFNDYLLGTTGPIRSFTELAGASGKIMDLSERLSYFNLSGEFYSDYMQKRKAEYEEYVAGVFDAHGLDAVALPTTNHKVFELVNRTETVSPGSTIASAIGYPAVSVPLGFDSDGLSYGLEFMAKKNNEGVLFEVIAGYEAIDPTIRISSHGPSLYEVSAEAGLLVENHRYLVSMKTPNVQVRKLIYENIEYFLNYSDNENRVTDAEVLNQKYEEIDIYAEDAILDTIGDFLENGNNKAGIFIKILLIIAGVGAAGFILLRLIVRFR